MSVNEVTLRAEDEILEMMVGRANFYRLLARVFIREVDAEFLGALGSQKELLAAMRGISRRGQSLLREFFQHLNEKAMDEVVLDLAVEYAALFLAVGRAQGRPTTPYASVYLGKEACLMQEPYVRIHEFYQRNGFSVAEVSSELDDHVAIVLEFLGRMAENTAECLKRGDIGSTREMILVQDTFLTEHVVTWVPTFCRDVSSRTSSSFYKAFALVTSAFVKTDKELMEEVAQDLAVSFTHAM